MRKRENGNKKNSATKKVDKWCDSDVDRANTQTATKKSAARSQTSQGLM